MSLLGDLAKNSCVIDFSLEELVSTLSIQHTVSEASETRSNHSGYSLISRTVVSPDRKRCAGVGRGLEGAAWGLESRYFQTYREKYSKIDCIVSMLSAKTRKLKYQFMVHLERQCKGQKDSRQEKQGKNETSSKVNQCKDRQNGLMFYSNLQQMISIVECKEKGIMREAFDRVHKKLRNWMKIDFFGKVIQECKRRAQLEEKRCAFRKFMLFTRNSGKVSKSTNFSKPIIFPNAIKTSKIKASCDGRPLPLTNLIQALQPQKLQAVYPQQKQQQNIDYCDTMNLFMTNEEKGSQYSVSKSSASFGVNSCVSAFDQSRRSSSPKSYHNIFSEIQFTAVPQSALQRGKASGFIYSEQERVASDYSHQGGNICEAQLSPTKSESGFYYKNLFMKAKQYHDDNIDQKQQIYDLQSKKEQAHQRRLSIPEEISRSRSEVKINPYRQDQKLHKEEIQVNYNVEMNRYLKFKKSLQERRNSTLKQIEKSQETIRKLMIKFKKEKCKSIKMKNTVTLQKTKESTIRSSSKNVREGTSRRTSLTQQNRKVQKNKRAERSWGKYATNQSLVSQKKRQFSPVLDQNSEKMNIYNHYIKQKKKMDSEKSTPNKKLPKGVTSEHNSAKKPDKKLLQLSAHKNLLALSEVPITKEPRIDVKVNLVNQSHKKVFHPSHKKQKGKHDHKTNQKAKLRPKVK